MLAVAPICALIVAHQRAVIQTIEDGKSAFEAGKAFGERLRRTSGVPPVLRTTTPPPSKK